MTLEQLKISLAQEILKSTDEQFIRSLSLLIKSRKDVEGTEEVPAHVWESVQKSREDIVQGKVHSWDEVKNMLTRK